MVVAVVVDDFDVVVIVVVVVTAQYNALYNPYISNPTGIVASIKASMMLDRKQICPSINFKNLNPKIKDDYGLEVSQEHDTHKYESVI